MSTYVEPTDGKIPRIIKAAIASVYCITPLVLLAHLIITEGAVNSFLDTLIVAISFAFILASGYIVFGKKRVGSAVDRVKEIRSKRRENQ